MKRIIVQKQKHGDIYYDASTKELEAKAFKKMFKFNDEDMQFYSEYEKKHYEKEVNKLEAHIKEFEECDITKLPTSLRDAATMAKSDIQQMKAELLKLKREKELYDSAKAGDLHCMRRLLERRKDGEYEGWSVEELS